jgi:CRISPR-associated protein Cas2
MTVLILENMSPGFRGEVTQWLLEVKAGVFVGNISAGVRQRLWKKVQDNVNDGAALIIYSAQNEQGFQMDVCRTPERSVVDLEGIFLIKRIVDAQ